jgi:hypothetical protein
MKIKNPFKKKKSLKENMEFVVKGLNDLTITHPELSGKFNQVTDMLERKLNELPNPPSK